jgi:hypothetical protein
MLNGDVNSQKYQSSHQAHLRDCVNPLCAAARSSPVTYPVGPALQAPPSPTIAQSSVGFAGLPSFPDVPRGSDTQPSLNYADLRDLVPPQVSNELRFAAIKHSLTKP